MIDINIIAIGNKEIEKNYILNYIVNGKYSYDFITREMKIKNFLEKKFLEIDNNIDYTVYEGSFEKSEFNEILNGVKKIKNENNRIHLILFFVKFDEEKEYREEIENIINISKIFKNEILVLSIGIEKLTSKQYKDIKKKLDIAKAPIKIVPICELKRNSLKNSSLDKIRTNFIGEEIIKSFYKTEKEKYINEFTNYCVREIYFSLGKVRKFGEDEIGFLKCSREFIDNLEGESFRELETVDIMINKLSKSFKISKDEISIEHNKENREDVLSDMFKNIIEEEVEDERKKRMGVIKRNLLKIFNINKKVGNDIEKNLILEGYRVRKMLESSFNEYEKNKFR